MPLTHIFLNNWALHPILASLIVFIHTTSWCAEDPAVQRGAYILRASGCVTCHTDPGSKDAFLAGGRVFKTPLGTFYSPNITIR